MDGGIARENRKRPEIAPPSLAPQGNDQLANVPIIRGVLFAPGWLDPTGAQSYEECMTKSRPGHLA